MQIGLAFRAFFAVLFGRPLPPEVLALAAPAGPAALAPGASDRAPAIAAAREELIAQKAGPTPPAAPPAAPADDPRRLHAAAVQVLAVLQTEGRLLDFLSEDIDGYSDADIGAAVRDVHRGLRRALADHFPVSHVREEDEESTLSVPEGFDPAELRLVGNVVGKPPFAGRLKHKGWMVREVRLPRLPSGRAAMIVAPAEVEL